jgi:hypothetical protein
MKQPLILLTLLASAGPAHADTSAPARALAVQVFGVQMSPELDVVEEVRRRIAARYTDGTIDTIITWGYGDEGGMGLCVQLSHWVDGRELTSLRQAIVEVAHDPRFTFISAEPQVSCRQ